GTLGRFGFIGMRCTQWPISAVGLGMYRECRPRLIGFQVLPASSVRKAPAEEMAMKILLGLLGSRTMVCKPRPPAPGAHLDPWTSRRAASSRQFLPPSVVLNRAASSTPA